MCYHELCNADAPYRRHTPLCTSRKTTEDVFHHISDILKLFAERLLEVRLFKETCVWLCCPWLKYGLLLFPYLWAALHAGMCVWKYCYVISLWSSLMVWTRSGDPGSGLVFRRQTEHFNRSSDWWWFNHTRITQCFSLRALRLTTFTALDVLCGHAFEGTINTWWTSWWCKWEIYIFYK